MVRHGVCILHFLVVFQNTPTLSSCTKPTRPFADNGVQCSQTFGTFRLTGYICNKFGEPLKPIEPSKLVIPIYRPCAIKSGRILIVYSEVGVFQRVWRKRCLDRPVGVVFGILFYEVLGMLVLVLDVEIDAVVGAVCSAASRSQVVSLVL